MVKISERTISTERVYFGSRFEKAQSMVSWTQVLGQKSTVMCLHLIVNRRQREGEQEGETEKRGGGESEDFQSHVPTHLLPLTRPHFLTFLEPSKTLPLSGNQSFKTHTYCVLRL